MDFSEDELYHIRAVLNSYGYGGDLWADRLDLYEEWKEGYILNYFDEENRKKLDEIVTLIKPDYFDWYENEESKRNLCKLLDTLFERNIDIITSDYSSYFERAGEAALKAELCNDFCDPFEESLIFLVGDRNRCNCFETYKTYVFDLKDLLLKNKVNTIADLIKKLSESYIGGLRHDTYEYGYNGPFDKESFNNDVSSELETIIEKIEDEPEKYAKNSSENGKLILILKKYPLRQKHQLTNDRGSFTIKEIKDGRIILIHLKPNGEEQVKSFSSEEFYNFISTSELFESIIRKLKKKL
jgi:hypothetical protein